VTRVVGVFVRFRAPLNKADDAIKI
jgi:hypothetical protein